MWGSRLGGGGERCVGEVDEEEEEENQLEE